MVQPLTKNRRTRFTARNLSLLLLICTPALVAGVIRGIGQRNTPVIIASAGMWVALTVVTVLVRSRELKIARKSRS